MCPASSTERVEDGNCGSCITVFLCHFFSLTLLLRCGPSHWLQSFRLSFSDAYPLYDAVLYDKPALQSMGSPRAARNSCFSAWSLSSSSDLGISSLVSHSFLLFPILVLCYLPFPEYVFMAEPPMPSGVPSAPQIWLSFDTAALLKWLKSSGTRWRWLEQTVTCTRQSSSPLWQPHHQLN